MFGILVHIKDCLQISAHERLYIHLIVMFLYGDVEFRRDKRCRIEIQGSRDGSHDLVLDQFLHEFRQWDSHLFREFLDGDLIIDIYFDLFDEIG